MMAVGRPAPACHPRAWPLHGGRDARRASSFPDSSPPPGERIKERGGRTAQAESKAEGGTYPEARGGASGPLTLPSPPKGRGKEQRASRARMTEAEAPRGGMTAVGRPPPACHPRAWPLHGGRDARRASPFPDSSPPPGERIKERRTHRASGVEGRGGTHPEARGGASSPPPPPLSPQGERETRTRTARGNDGSAPRSGALANRPAIPDNPQ